MKLILLILLFTSSALAQFTPFPPAPVAEGTLNTKGDVLTHDGSDDFVLGVGTDGQVIKADSGATGGVSWQDAYVSLLTTVGDLLYRDGSGDQRLPLGTEGQLLTVDTGLPIWKDAPVSTTLDTKGQIQGHDGTDNVAIPAASGDGMNLVSDSTADSGNVWSNSIQGKFSQVSDEVGYTPTFTALGTPTEVNFVHWRVGDKLHIRGHFSAGTGSASEARIDLPNSLIIKAGTGSTYSVGTYFRDNVGGAATSKGGSILATAGDGFINFGRKGVFSSSGTATAFNVENGDTFTSGDRVGFNIRLPIEGWTNGLDGVVENKVLTAQTANSLTAEIDETGAIISRDLDFLSSCSWSGENLTCDYDSSKVILTEVPMIQCTAYNASGSTLSGCQNQPSSTVSQFTVKVEDGASNTLVVTVNKVGADYNKNVIQAATLQGINSSDIIEISAAGNEGEVITVNTEAIPFIATEDVQGNWDGDELVPTKAGRFDFEGNVYFTAGALRYIYISVNRQGGGYIEEEIVSDGVADAHTSTKFSGKVDLLVGDRMRLIVRSNGGTLSNDSQLHYIKITQSADYEAIILNQSKSADRCQYKYLSSNIGVVTGISDLQFNNLVIGKKYEITTNFRYVPTGADTGILDTKHDGNSVCRNSVYSAAAQTPNSFATCTFTATATTLTHDTISLAGGSSGTGDGTVTQTHARLCYKGNTISTTEFN